MRHEPNRYSGSAYGNRTRPSALATRDAPCTPRPKRWTGIVHRPIDVRRLSKTPLLRAGGAALATAPGFEPGPASLGGSDALRYTTLPVRLLSTVSKTSPPRDLARVSCGREAKTKKAFQGIALEGLVLDECRAFRALCPPWSYPANRAHTCRLARRWPNRMATPWMNLAN